MSLKIKLDRGYGRCAADQCIAVGGRVQRFGGGGEFALDQGTFAIVADARTTGPAHGNGTGFNELEQAAEGVRPDRFARTSPSVRRTRDRSDNEATLPRRWRSGVNALDKKHPLESYLREAAVVPLYDAGIIGICKCARSGVGSWTPISTRAPLPLRVRSRSRSQWRAQVSTARYRPRRPMIARG